MSAQQAFDDTYRAVAETIRYIDAIGADEGLLSKDLGQVRQRLVGIIHHAADTQYPPEPDPPLTLKVKPGFLDSLSHQIGPVLACLEIPAAGVLIIPVEPS